jgi:hypothetical protein
VKLEQDRNDNKNANIIVDAPNDVYKLPDYFESFKL